MKVKILKGTNQIGGCITEITSNKGNKIIIDYGCDLNKNTEILPDINWEDIKGVFITHNHDDHIGHINEIPSNVKVYVEEVSFGVYCILNEFLLNSKKMREVNTFKIGDSIKIKDDEKTDIEVISYVVDHSSFNSVMYLVKCDGKTLLHMGDFRNNGKKGPLLKETLERIASVDVLVMEGTTVTRENNRKNKTEEELEEWIEDTVKKYDQVLIMQSSTNIDRICTMYNAMKNTGKIFLEDSCTANICSYLFENGYDYVPNVTDEDVYSFLPFNRREDYNNPTEFYKTYLAPFNRRDGHKKLGNNDFALMVKQSMLRDIKARYNEGKLNNACLIYSMWHDYLDDPKMQSFMNKIKDMKIKVFERHTSGHADEEARQLVINTLEYKYLIPIHTENKEKYIEYPNSVILEDNKELEII